MKSFNNKKWLRFYSNILNNYSFFSMISEFLTILHFYNKPFILPIYNLKYQLMIGL